MARRSVAAAALGGLAIIAASAVALNASATPAPKPKPGAVAGPTAKPAPETTSAVPKPTRVASISMGAGPSRKPSDADAGGLAGLKDLRAFTAVIDTARAGRFDEARSKVTSAMGPAAIEIVDWLRFRSTSETPIEASEFLESHKGWPSSRTIRFNIERGILRGHANRNFANAYFAANPPTSGNGYVALGALAQEAGNAEVARKWFRKAWRESTLDTKTERQILSLCGNCIGPAEEKARLDAMIYKGKYRTASRAASRLGKSQEKLVKARITALKGSRNTAKAISALPSSLRGDLGLTHSRIRYLRRKDAHGDARKLLLGAPSDHAKLISPASWWTERRLLARHALGAGKPKDAYRMAAAHGYSAGNNFAEGEFLAGWIALRYLNDAKTARRHFEALRAGVTRAPSITRAEYWLGRVKEKLGDDAGARAHFQTAASVSRNFYGQLAREHLGGTLLLMDLPAEARASEKDRKSFAERHMVQAARMLGAAGHTDLAALFVSALSYDIREPGEYALLARLAEGLSLPHVAVRVGKVAVSRDVALNGAAYPLDNFPAPKKSAVETALIGGIARQESEFNWRANSHAGAKGLMQIMPGTAKDISRNHGFPLSLPRLVEDPAYNAAMGTAYLGELIDRFDGSYVLAIAGYNAGPGRVREWIGHYGDPRTSAIEPLDWIESIPFNETRAYVQRVLENVQIYRARIAGSARPITLTADLERGRRVGRRAAVE